MTPDVGINPFYVGIPSSVEAANDHEILSRLFEGRSEVATPATGPLHESLPQGFRYHDISSYIPRYEQEKLGTREGGPGPNCYHVVMSVFRGDNFKDRYVHDEELSYYFTRYFKVASARDIFGGALIYTRGGFSSSGIHLTGGFGMAGGQGFDISSLGVTPSGVITLSVPGAFRPSVIPKSLRNSRSHMPVPPENPEVEDPDFLPMSLNEYMLSAFGAAGEVRYIMPVDPGEHGAIMLLAGMVFQKGCYGDYCGYKIVPAGKAISSIEILQERWAPPQKPEDDSEFRYSVYVPFDGDPVQRFGFNDELSKRVEDYLPAINYYIGRFRAVKDLRWNDFKSARIDLLTVENVWGLLKQVEELFSAEGNPMTALLRIAPEAAERYQELQSLSWQHQAMVDKFWPFKDTWLRDRVDQELDNLYRQKYFHPESEEFRKEIVVHLQSRGIPKDRWDEIVDKVVDKIRAIDPLTFSRSNGSQGIKFFEILAEAIG